MPAICEELAFRGFMLSGLRHLGHKWQAILISSIFFGVTHQVFHQSILACVVGLVLGYLAVQTGSLLPCIVFHFTHNSMPVVLGSLVKEPVAKQWPWNAMVSSSEQLPYAFTWPMPVVGCIIAAGLLYCFHRLPYARTSEETLQDALEHQGDASPAAAGS